MSLLDKHGIIERNATLLLVGSLVVVSIGGIVEIAPLFYLENTIEKVEGMRPYSPLELAGRNIGVTSVHPGMIRTNIAKVSRCSDSAMQQRMVEWFERWGRPPELVANKIVRAIETNRMRVLVTPETYVMDLFKRATPALAERVSGTLMHRLRNVVNPGRQQRDRGRDGAADEPGRRAA